MPKTDYWWYRAYLLALKITYEKPKLADGLDVLWNKQDLPLPERNKRLLVILTSLQ